MKKTLRTFIAIDLEPHVTETLRSIQQRLQKAEADVKWTETENLHLTLKFLGDIESSDVPAITQIMASAASGHPPFSITIAELGAFPDILLPKIIWAGITVNADILTRIAKYLDANLQSLRIKKEDRAFSAHITLGRVKSWRGKDRLCAALEETNIPSGITQTVKQLTLFQSELTPHGPVYKILHTHPFTNTIE